MWATWWRPLLVGMSVVVTQLSVSTGASAQALDYSAIDAATVRVLGLGEVGLLEVTHDGKRHVLAAPMGGHGSGVIVSEDGLVLTAAHVVEDVRVLAVHLAGETQGRPALVVYRDAKRDVAILRIPGEVPAPAQLGEPDAHLQIRQTVYAIGYPLNPTRTDPQSTRGVVSGALPDGSLQLDLTVNPGNSGGPLIDENDTVQGLVVARSRLDEGAVGLAFSVPVTAFLEAVRSQEAKELPSADREELESEQSQQLANLVSLVAQLAPELLEEALQVEQAETLVGKIQELESRLEGSPDAKLLVAAYYWNRHVALKVAGASDWYEVRQLAEERCREAVELEPELRKTSPFVAHVLRGEGGMDTEDGEEPDWGAAAADGSLYEGLDLRVGTLRVHAVASATLGHRAAALMFEEPSGRVTSLAAGVQIAPAVVAEELFRIGPIVQVTSGPVFSNAGGYQKGALVWNVGLEGGVFLPTQSPTYFFAHTYYEQFNGPIRDGDARSIAGLGFGLGLAAEAFHLAPRVTGGFSASLEFAYDEAKLPKSSPLATPDFDEDGSLDEFGSPDENWALGRITTGFGLSFW